MKSAITSGLIYILFPNISVCRSCVDSQSSQLVQCKNKGTMKYNIFDTLAFGFWSFRLDIWPGLKIRQLFIVSISLDVWCIEVHGCTLTYLNPNSKFLILIRCFSLCFVFFFPNTFHLIALYYYSCGAWLSCKAYH